MPSGYCTFTNLNKGYYLIEESPQVRNGSFQWFNSTSSSNLVEINSRNESISVGNYLVEWRYTLRGYVFNDVTPDYGNGTHGNGIKDGADSGLFNWTVIYLRITGIPQFGIAKTDINGYYVLAFFGACVGIWISLQLTPKLRLRHDAYGYFVRLLILLVIFILLASFSSAKLALYPATALFLMSLAMLVRQPILKFLFWLLSPHFPSPPFTSLR
jgi:hypothetical protein